MFDDSSSSSSSDDISAGEGSYFSKVLTSPLGEGAYFSG